MSYIPVESYTPQIPDVSTVNLASSATTTVVDVAETGLLVHLGFECQSTPTGNPAADVILTIDGGTPVTVPVFQTGNLFSDELQGMSRVGDGDSADDHVVWNLGSRYGASLKVEIDVTSAGSGTFVVSVSRAKRL